MSHSKHITFYQRYHYSSLLNSNFMKQGDKIRVASDIKSTTRSSSSDPLTVSCYPGYLPEKNTLISTELSRRYHQMSASLSSLATKYHHSTGIRCHDFSVTARCKLQ